MSEEARHSVSGTSGAASKNTVAAPELIDVMLEKLKLLKLTPSPLPRKVIEAFPANSINVTDECSYCGTNNVKLVVPEVDLNLKVKTATLRCHKNICALCHEVFDVKTLLNHISKALMKKKDDFDRVYQHFCEINNIKDTHGTALQEVVSIAYSLHLIYAEIPWQFTDA